MSKLSEDQRDEIIYSYSTGYSSQTHLAHYYKVSRRTIGRVLRDAGLTQPMNTVSYIEMGMVELLRKYKMNARTLRVLFKIAYPEVK